MATHNGQELQTIGPSRRIEGNFIDGRRGIAECFESTGPLPSVRRHLSEDARVNSVLVEAPLVNGIATARFNSWLYRSKFIYEKCTYTQHNSDEGRNFTLSWVFKWTQMSAQGTTTAFSLKEAKEKLSILFMKILVPEVQMDAPKESVQGRDIAEADQASNTIVTRDAEQTVSSLEALRSLQDYVSSEKAVYMSDITSRWLPLPVLTINTSAAAESVIATYDFPTDLFTLAPSVINTLPFRSFIYSDFACEMKLLMRIVSRMGKRLSLSGMTPLAYVRILKHSKVLCVALM